MTPSFMDVMDRMKASLEAERRRRILIIAGTGLGVLLMLGASVYVGIKGI